jgi:hypothetical protein
MTHALEMTIVRLDDLFALSLSADTVHLARVLGGWLAQSLKKKPGDGALCITCDSEFPGMRDMSSHDWSAILVMPFASGAGQAIVSGICPACSVRPDLQDAVTRQLRSGSVWRRPQDPRTRLRLKRRSRIELQPILDTSWTAHPGRKFLNLSNIL